jgi:hypothetical protein
MTRIPVGKTIAHAYRFVFANIPAIVRAIGLPLLAQLVVIFLLTKRAALFMAAAQAHDPSAPSLVGPLLLLFLLTLIFFFAQFTAATQTALGRPPQSWLSLPFGKPMWRLMGGFITALAATAAVGLVLFLALWLVAFGLDQVVKVAPGSRQIVAVLAGLMVAAFFCALLFVLLRFLFLLAPVSVAEEQLGVKRSWKLSAGNFWRIFLVTLAIALPVTIVNYTYGYFMAGPLHIAPGASKETIEAAQMAWRITQLNAMAERWYITLPLTALVMLFQLGAGCAAQVFAWRTLTEGEASAPVAAD